MNKTTGIDFDTLFDNASMGIVVANEKGEIIMTNPFLQQQFIYGPGELNGSPVEKLIPARFESRHKSHVHGYNIHPKSRPMGLGMDLFGLRKDGIEFPVEVSLSNYSTDRGKFTIAFISDISARKKAELSLKELNEELESKITSRTATITRKVKQLAELITETEQKDAKLRRANTFLRSTWENAEVIIYVTDDSGIIKMFNPAAERELGYKASELTGLYTPAILHSQDTLEKKAKELSRELGKSVEKGFDALKEKTDLGLKNEMEIDYLRKDGSCLPATLTLTAMPTSGKGKIAGYLGIAINISERRNAENELLQLLKREQEMSEFKSRFVSMASHEFRTPLSTILSSAYLISKYTSVSDQGKRGRHVERIVSMVQLLTDVLNDFLSIEKIEQNKVEVHNITFNIEEHINNIVSELETLRKKGQDIRFSHQGQASINTDPTMLKHIIINLVSNAIKFSPEDSIIEISSSKDANRISLCFKDKGIGIPLEDQKHLFERFFRAGNATNIQGTGLGLYIVSRYVELMGGKISCNSSPEIGTAFVVEFKNQ